jgi:hypothetical protein
MNLVRLARFELATYPYEGAALSELSYKRTMRVAVTSLMATRT